MFVSVIINKPILLTSGYNMTNTLRMPYNVIAENKDKIIKIVFDVAVKAFEQK